MSSKRERYERANMRGGLGVRKKLSEESLRQTYRLNGVRTGFAVARCFDKYGRWEHGYTVGMIVRQTSSVVQIRWLGDEDISTYNQGDARYEVDRGRWRILGAVQGNPLDPENPLVDALTSIAENARIQASANADTPPTEETENMPEKMSNAAAERAAAQQALSKGDLKERTTYTAKQVATRCGTDSKTMRKFFRSSHSTVEPVGQGGRYEFDAKDLPKIKREFDAWKTKSNAKASTPKPKPEPETVPIQDIVEKVNNEFTLDQLTDTIERVQDDDEEPSEEELAELEDMDIDLDDIDED